MDDVTITRRVVHLGGYDPMTADAFHRRFWRELSRFERCWGVTATTSDFSQTASSAVWTVTVSGPGWRVVSHHELVRWDDIIMGHRSADALTRWRRGLAAFADFIWHGALVGYITQAWRYAAFFLYPYAALALLLAAGGAAGWGLSWLGMPWPLAAASGAALGFGAMLHAIGRSHVGHLLDDWIFARELVRGVPAPLAQRLADAGRRLAEMPQGVDCLVVGHSLGAVLAVSLLDEALKQPPRRERIGFLAVGSSILKIALHGRAAGLRARLGRLAARRRVDWAEYQAINDVMNFYRRDPIKVLGLSGESPIVRQVRFRRMLAPAFYARIKRNFFRLHCQFVSGNDRRAPYDYLMSVCGPFRLIELARSPDGAERWLDAQGAVTEAGRAALLPAMTAEGAPADRPAEAASNVLPLLSRRQRHA